jgi:TPR repeat protein
MAMIKCSECGKDISDKASVCIGCGAPLLSVPDAATVIAALQTAADQGYAVAQCKLGARYENGDGVPLDYDKAIYWYRLAAEQGDAEAQKNLGLMCSKGQVVMDGVQVGDVTGDGQIDYEDFKLAVSKSKQFASDKVEEAVNFGKEKLQSAKEKDAASLESLAGNTGPIVLTESQKKRDRFKAALESTIGVKFADIMRGKTGDEVYLTYFDAKLLTASVRNIYRHSLRIIPGDVETALCLSEAVLAPSTLEKINRLKAAIGAGGAIAGISAVLAAVGLALGWGTGAIYAFTTFFTGVHLLGPLGLAASGLALAGFAAYFASTSNKQTDSERFIKVLTTSSLKAVDKIWEEYESELSKSLPAEVKV